MVYPKTELPFKHGGSGSTDHHHINSASPDQERTTARLENISTGVRWLDCFRSSMKVRQIQSSKHIPCERPPPRKFAEVAPPRIPWTSVFSFYPSLSSNERISVPTSLDEPQPKLSPAIMMGYFVFISSFSTAQQRKGHRFKTNPVALSIYLRRFRFASSTRGSSTL